MASNDVKEAPRTGKKGGIDFVSETVDETIAYLKKEVKPLLSRMLIIEAASMAAFLVFVLIACLFMLPPFFGLISTAITQPASLTDEILANRLAEIFTDWTNMALFSVGALLLLLGTLVSMYISSTIHNQVADSMAGKNTPIINQAKENALPYTGYMLVMVVLLGIVFLPSVLVLFLAPGGTKLLALPLFALAGLLILAISFFFQFAAWELLVARKGPVESLKQSYALVRNNLKNVFIFDLAYFAGMIFLGFIYGALGAAVQLVSSIFMILAPFIGIAVYVGLYSIIVLIEAAVTAATLMVLTYVFWKKTKGEPYRP